MEDLPDFVELVDSNDDPIGTLDKFEAHRQGALHRAFSVSVSDRAGRLLLQKRAHTKYHSGGLWTNTCCGHPRPGEPVAAAARRRLIEEMGISCPLTLLFRTHYCATVSNDLIENELVHVFGGRFEGRPTPDSNEVEEWRWDAIEAIAQDVVCRSELYSVWFIKYVSEFRSELSWETYG